MNCNLDKKKREKWSKFSIIGILGDFEKNRWEIRKKGKEGTGSDLCNRKNWVKR